MKKDSFIKEAWKNIKQHNCYLNIDNNKFLEQQNQNIIMISKWSCDTEGWSNDAENSTLASQE